MPGPHIQHIIQQNVSRGDSRQFHHYHMSFGRRPDRGRSFWKRFFFWLIMVMLAGFVALSIGFVGLVAWFARDLPDPDKINLRTLAQTTKIYDRTGEHLLYEIHGDQKRTIVGLEEISKYAKAATLAAEDKDFYKHRGFVIRGFVRAFYVNLIHGGKLQGGSTITQQFVKNSMLTSEKTYTRKIKELVLSMEIERRFTKDQILKLYLNEIPYGSVSYGIESAAQTFFGQSAKDLSISESAVLAAMAKAPTYYSPFGSHRDELLARADYVIDVMRDQGDITAEEAQTAKDDDVLARIQPKRESILAPHFVFYVRELLADEFGEEAVERGGFKVTTTLDMDKQDIAEKAITDNLETIKSWGGSTAAMMAVDPKNGEILAMVGSPDYFDEEHNGKFNALFGRRQPGSSMKPLVYALGFEKGYTPDTVLYDVVTQFQKPPHEYKPSDYDGAERGPVTVREALAGSLNIPAVKMLYLVGVTDFLDFISDKFGYSTYADRSRYGLSLVLGGGEVKPFEHISAFSVFPREGLYRPPKGLLKVEDNDGRVLLDQTSPTPEKKAYSRETAYQINSILSDNAARAFIFGEKNWLTLPDRPVAAKTGTTDKFKDAWTIGYTPSLVAGVWVGNMDGAEMKPKADGSKVAAPVWNQFMREALKGKPVENFTAPQPVATGKPVLDGLKNAQVMVKIDKVTGRLATDYTPAELAVEKGFGVPHDILFFCDKKDPRGPVPEDPAKDPQFEPWETAVAEWAVKQKISFEPPPTERDNVHLPENAPTVALARPTEGETMGERTTFVSVTAQAKRGVAKVVYLLDDEPIATFEYQPFSGQVTIPNRYSKGFHVLTAKAYDDVGNRSSASVTINLTAEAGPLTVQWLSPWNDQYLNSVQFPFNISFRIDDYKGVKKLRLSAVNQIDQTEELIGTVDNPVLPNMSMNWNLPSGYGKYVLRIVATLQSGDDRVSEMTVNVMQ